MSTERKRKRTAPESSPGEREVAAWLRAHPDYFERHPALLVHLRLPHDTGTNTVSLIERQVDILRDKNRKLDGKLRELLSLARANDALAARIHRLALRLIEARNRAETLASIERTLDEELGSDRSVLVLFEEQDAATAPAESFVRMLARDDAGLAQLRSFLQAGRPRCGQVKGAKRQFLFGDGGADIRSAALIPLGDKASRGFVAIGSRKATRFHPGMSTDFLARLGELIDRGLSAAS